MRVELANISYKINKKSLIENICMNINPKEFVGLIGPNGSGKSTILKCIYRVLKPSNGAIFFDGQNITELSIKESALKVAVVVQHNFTSFDFDVLDVVLMGRSPYKRLMEADNKNDYDIAHQALVIVGLEGFSKRKISTLSGGERQRVIIARALAQKTPCLILDEPINHLDIKFQLQTMDMIKKMNVTVIAAIHDLNIAATYCDNIYAINNGRIVAQGKPAQIFTTEFIHDIFGVQAKVETCSETGFVNILYRNV
ncbi:MAG: ABC transporter ATP-binding protein [Deltaproteobacteria bacterium]|jgi:iron complex transport system ATP-binding protein|nr:ABC transporter ATP-binding protein [Deltaproteobacteria bacterium]